MQNQVMAKEKLDMINEENNWNNFTSKGVH